MKPQHSQCQEMCSWHVWPEAKVGHGAANLVAENKRTTSKLLSPEGFYTTGAWLKPPAFPLSGGLQPKDCGNILQVVRAPCFFFFLSKRLILSSRDKTCSSGLVHRIEADWDQHSHALISVQITWRRAGVSCSGDGALSIAAFYQYCVAFVFILLIWNAYREMEKKRSGGGRKEGIEKERKRYKDRERTNSSICWFTSQTTTTIGAELGYKVKYWELNPVIPYGQQGSSYLLHTPLLPSCTQE